MKFRRINSGPEVLTSFAGLSPNEISKVQCTANIFCITKRKMKLERLVDSREELHNAAKYEGYFQNFYPFVYFDSS
jgi:hypothetical protein